MENPTNITGLIALLYLDQKKGWALLEWFET